MKLKNTRSTNQLSSTRALSIRKKKVANGGYLLPELKTCAKIEIYDCGEHESVVALHLSGKKPKGITCPVCKRVAMLKMSTTYSASSHTAAFEWAQPPVEDLRYMPKNMRDYFITGGLFLRTIKKTETPT